MQREPYFFVSLSTHRVTFPLLFRASDLSFLVFVFDHVNVIRLHTHAYVNSNGKGRETERQRQRDREIERDLCFFVCK